jgi:hypothetical protein
MDATFGASERSLAIGKEKFASPLTLLLRFHGRMRQYLLSGLITIR